MRYSTAFFVTALLVAVTAAASDQIDGARAREAQARLDAKQAATTQRVGPLLEEIANLKRENAKLKADLAAKDEQINTLSRQLQSEWDKTKPTTQPVAGKVLRDILRPGANVKVINAEIAKGRTTVEARVLNESATTTTVEYVTSTGPTPGRRVAIATYTTSDGNLLNVMWYSGE